MPFYEEFPFDHVVNVHWRKKKKPPPPSGTGGKLHLPPATCGMWLSWTHFGGVMELQSGGLFLLADGMDGSVPSVFRETAPRLDRVRDNSGGFSDYLWEPPITGFTITASNEIPDYFPALAVLVFRNRNPLTFNVCDGADQIGNPVEVAPRQPTEEFYPLAAVVNLRGAGGCSISPATVTVQAHCEHETDGDIPQPQPGPPFNVGLELIGPIS